MDRRRREVPEAGSSAQALAPLVIVVLVAAGVAIDVLWGAMAGPDSDIVLASTCAATSMLAMVAGALLLLRWRLGGQIRAAAMGLAVLVLLGLHPALQGLAVTVKHPVPSLPEVDLGLMVTGLGLLLVERRHAPVDTQRRATSLLAAVLGSWLAVSLVPALLGVRPHGVATPLSLWTSLFGSAPWTRVILACLLIGLAAPLGLNGARRHLHIDYWVALGLAAWSCGIGVEVLLVQRPLTPVVTTGLRGVGAGMILWGVISELARDFARQRSALYITQISELATLAEERAAREQQRSRAHNARSVVMAVQTAGLALQKDTSTLDSQHRATLAEILRAGLVELDRYVAAPRAQDEFELAELLGPARDWARSLGATLQATLPADMRAAGGQGPLLEVIRTVIAAMAADRRVEVIRMAASGNSDEVCISLEVAASRPGPSGGTGARPARSLELVAAEELLRRHDGRLEECSSASGSVGYAVWVAAAPRRVSN